MVYFSTIIHFIHQFISDNSLKLLCTSHNMTLYISRNQSVTSSELVITLKDASCNSVTNSTHHILTTSFDECGTTAVSNNDFIIYENIVVVKSKAAANSVIVRKSDLSETVELKCLFSRMSVIKSAVFILEGIYFRISYSAIE